jgi:hypothetical protein
MKRLTLCLFLASILAVGSTSARAEPPRSRGLVQQLRAKLARDARQIGDALGSLGATMSQSLVGPRLQLATVPVAASSARYSTLPRASRGERGSNLLTISWFGKKKQGDEGGYAGEHENNQRGSNWQKHTDAQHRRTDDQNGEKKDKKKGWEDRSGKRR